MEHEAGGGPEWFPVVVELTKLHDSIGALHGAVAGLRSDVAAMGRRLDEHVTNDHDAHNDHERRLRANERWRYALPIGAVLMLTNFAVALKGLA